jgi:RimJ/RimL family protein N-acetyltransferase
MIETTMTTRILTTNRLILRPLDRSDAPQIQEEFPHMEVLRYLSAAIPRPYPHDGAVQYISSAPSKPGEGREYRWAITLRGGGDRLIGIISLTPASP